MRNDSGKFRRGIPYTIAPGMICRCDAEKVLYGLSDLVDGVNAFNDTALFNVSHWRQLRHCKADVSDVYEVRYTGVDDFSFRFSLLRSYSTIVSVVVSGYMRGEHLPVTVCHFNNFSTTTAKHMRMWENEIIEHCDYAYVISCGFKSCIYSRISTDWTMCERYDFPAIEKRDFTATDYRMFFNPLFHQYVYMMKAVQRGSARVTVKRCPGVFF